VSVSPSAPTVAFLHTQQFTATVTGTNGPSQAVTWAATQGTITAAGLYTAPTSGTTDTVTATSIENSAISGAAMITVQAPPTVGYYGSQIQADDIANIVIGWNPLNDDMNRCADIRVLCNHTGTLESIRPFFIWSLVKAGYNLGTGGVILIEVQADDGTANHFPSGTTLASYTYHPPQPWAVNYLNWPLLTFATPPSLVAGKIYHFIFSNIDPDPKANWISLDNLWLYETEPQRQPCWPDADMDILEKNEAGNWVVYNRGTGSITPVFELAYADGASQGQGYIQGYCAQTVAGDGWVNPKAIQGTSGVRETFTVSGGNKTVSSVSVRVNRISGASPLTLSLLAADGATVLATGAVMAPKGGANTSSFCGESWVTVTFPSPFTLVSGTAYFLELSSPEDTLHQTHALNRGTTYGFSAPTCFADGYAQFTTGSGWSGFDVWGLQNRTDCDLQFYFNVIAD
jgi:hypothetical protein